MLSGFSWSEKRQAGQKGRFRLPTIATDADRVVLDGTELTMLLGGFDLARRRRQPAWHREQGLPA